MLYYIYKITNTINNKIYIGQHKVRPNERLRDYMGKGLAIREAYKKYGRSNFTKEILEYIEDDTKHLRVSERERFWIKQLNSKVPNGYNISDGGEGGCSKEAALKGALTRKKNNYKHSEETKLKQSEAKKGIPFSETHKKHLSEHHRLRKSYRILLENGSEKLIQDTLTNIAKQYNTSPNTLRRHSVKRIFTNGIMLLDIEPENYACCDSYFKKYKYIKCKDPIKGDICSYTALRLRIYKNKELYNGIVLKDCILGGTLYEI